MISEDFKKSLLKRTQGEPPGKLTDLFDKKYLFWINEFHDQTLKQSEVYENLLHEALRKSTKTIQLFLVKYRKNSG